MGFSVAGGPGARRLTAYPADPLIGCAREERGLSYVLVSQPKVTLMSSHYVNTARSLVVLDPVPQV